MKAGEALKSFLREARELKEYLSYFSSAKADEVKASVRNTGLWIGVGALGFVVLCGLLVNACWLLMSGMALGIAVLAGDRAWVGGLITGTLWLAGLGLGVYFSVAKLQRVFRERTIRKYEAMQAQQRVQFGSDVSQRASEASDD